MTPVTIAVVAIGWIACGLLAYGRTLAHFQRTYPLIARSHASSDVTFALWMASLGPFGAIVAVFASMGSRCGLLWRPIDIEEAARIYAEQYARRYGSHLTPERARWYVSL